MPRRSRPAAEPDLFSLDPAPPRPAPPAEPRAATSPGAEPATSVDDIGRAIAGWSDDELERLRAVVAGELRRRGLLRAEPAHAPPSASGVKSAAGQAARQRRHGASVQEVAPGQASAIRAASQAGMGLGKIAREFGLPVATVKRVLSTLAPTGST
jgi:LysM repeat protein